MPLQDNKLLHSTEGILYSTRWELGFSAFCKPIIKCTVSSCMTRLIATKSSQHKYYGVVGTAYTTESFRSQHEQEQER